MRHDLQHTWSRHFLQRAVDLALQAEQQGNLPVGAVLVHGDRIVAESASRTFVPVLHPGRHAEVQALAGLPDELAARAPEMTCYCTLEPCLMCFGTLVLHRMGAVVFGATDPRGGAVGSGSGRSGRRSAVRSRSEPWRDSGAAPSSQEGIDANQWTVPGA